MSRVKLEPFDNVGVSKRATLKTSRVLGNTVEAIHLKLGGTFTKAQMDLIRVKLNQKTIVEVTGAQLDKMNLYSGWPASATHITIPFCEHRSRTIQGGLLGAVDTSLGIRDFTVEVDISAAPTAPTLQAWADISPPKLLQNPQENGLIRALLLSTLTPNSAAKHTLSVNAGSAAGALLKRLYIFHANLTQFAVKRDGIDVYEEVDTALNSYCQDNMGHDPQSGLYVADFIEDDNQSRTLTTRRPDGSEVTHQFQFTVSAADTLQVISDVYAPLVLI